MAEQFYTFKEDLENIGIHITDEQYSDLCEINLFMKDLMVLYQTLSWLALQLH